MKDYVIIHTQTAKIITAMNFKTILRQLLSSIFMRVNKSYAINVGFVESLKADFISLGNKTEIPLGRSYKENFVNNFIKKNLLQRGRK